MIFQSLSRITTVAALTVSLASAVVAQDEEVVLQVTLAEETHSFTLSDLKSMPVSRFETTTIWTDGAQEFEGVSLEQLFETLSINEGTITATAINDYAVEIPMSDAVEDGPIIAYHTNGEEMSRRDKGPLWVVYPYDSDIAYQTELVYSRSIWQLDRISVE